MALETGNRETYNRQTRDLLPVGLLDPMTMAGLMNDPSPALLLAADGRTPLWASNEAARRFGYGDAMRLMRGRLPDTAPGTRRLAEIGTTGDTAGSMPRLERLRFFVGFRGVVLTVLCRRLRLGDGREGILVSFPDADLSTEAIEAGSSDEYRAVTVAPDDAARTPRAEEIIVPRVVAPVDPREALLPAANLIREARASLDQGQADPAASIGEAGNRMGDATQQGQADEAPPQESAVPEGPVLGPLSRAMSTFASPVANTADAAGNGLAESEAVRAPAFPGPAQGPAWLDLPAGKRGMRRFVFSLSADGELLDIGATLAEVVGSGVLAAGGGSLADAIATIDRKAAAEIGAAIEAGETFTDVSVEWPVGGRNIRVPVVLSALPTVDGGGGLTGFRGFGLIRIADARREDGSSAFEAPPMPEMPPAVAARAFDPDHEEPGSEHDAPGASIEPGEADADSADLAADDLAHIEPTIVSDDGAPADVVLETDDALDPDEPSPGDEAGHDSREEGDDAAAASGAQDTAGPAARLRVAPFPLPGGRRAGDPPGTHNVVSILNGQPSPAMPGFQRQGLSMSEKNAFREIAKALGARLEEDGGDEGLAPKRAAELAEGPKRAEDALPPSSRQDASDEAIPPIAMPEGSAADMALLDRLPVGLLVLKGDEPLFVNRTLLDLTAYPDYATFVAEGGPRAIFRKGVTPREENVNPDPMVLASRDGTMIPVEAHLQMIEWRGTRATMLTIRRAVELEQGKALRTVAFDLKRARSEAQELRAILDTATDGVLTLDENGHLLSMNGAAEALFGISQNEIVGEHVTRLIANDSHAVVTDYIDGMRANGVRSVLNDGREIMGREKKGGRMPLFMTLGRINEEAPLRFCAVLRDLTAWKRAEAELTDARRTAEIASAKKSDFLAKISHEIRTPMNAIIGFSEVMQEERLGPIGTPKYKEYLADIRTSGQHVVSLVNDLLDLAKIEAGRMELDFQATDLNAIVGSAVAIIQPQANTNKVLVRSQLANRLPLVVADERSVRQIVLNILSNATRFTEAGGQVIVSTSLLDGGEAVIRIRDTGIGMSPAEIEQALEPFRQVGTRRDKGGTGLGLPLTKALVEANRANFAIRSHPGEGTMVEITFPATRVLAE